MTFGGLIEKEAIPGEFLMEAALRHFASAQIEPPVMVDHSAVLSGLAAVQKEVEAIADRKQALQVIVGCALTFARATGAAIALRGEELGDEDRDERWGEEMICCAVAGCDAPPLESRLQVGLGFSGECVRSRKLLSCEDSETDSRVDRETCRILGIRSMVAVPVIREGVAVGLLEAFSPQPGGFVSSDHSALEQLAGMIAGILTRSSESAHQPEGEAATPEFSGGLRFGDTRSRRLVQLQIFQTVTDCGRGHAADCFVVVVGSERNGQKRRQ